MKKSILLFLLIFVSIIVNAQHQIGQDIVGDATNDLSGVSKFKF